MTSPAPDEDGLEPEDDGEPCPSIADPRTGLSRLLAERCLTCIMRAGDPMFLGPERTAAFIREALAEGTYVICHDTYDEPAICRGFFDAYRDKTPALRILQAYRRLIQVPHPAGEPGRTAAPSAADTATTPPRHPVRPGRRQPGSGRPRGADGQPRRRSPPPPPEPVPPPPAPPWRRTASGCTAASPLTVLTWSGRCPLSGIRSAGGRRSRARTWWPDSPPPAPAGMAPGTATTWARS
jgi:hypothetical protein